MLPRKEQVKLNKLYSYFRTIDQCRITPTTFREKRAAASLNSAEQRSRQLFIMSTKDPHPKMHKTTEGGIQTARGQWH